MSDYKERPYVFVKIDDYFNEAIKKRSGPWYFCDIGEGIGSFRHGEIVQISAGAFKIAKWMKDNKKDKSPVYYQAKEGIKRLIFDNDEIANKFNKWIKKQTLGNYENYQLWESPRSFLKSMDDNTELHIEAKVRDRGLFEHYHSDILSKEIFDLYCWVEDNLNTVYYENHTLFFKRKKDAVAFKLKWCKGKKAKDD